MSMVWIASGVPTVGSFSFEFTNIPQTFTHLQMRYFFRGADAGANTFTAMSINGNQYTTNYSFHTLGADGASVYITAGTSGGGISNLYGPASTSTANVFAAGVTDVLDYTNTNKNKTVKTIQGYDANGSGQMIFSSGQLLSTAAITSIGLFNMNFAANCRFDLYGITSSQVTGA